MISSANIKSLTVQRWFDPMRPSGDLPGFGNLEGPEGNYFVYYIL